MSGICGILHFDGKPAELNAVMDSMDFYGPDGSATWQQGPVALGHQMLHVTPESLDERLPWCDENAMLTITADARIDNRDELFSALRIPHAERAAMPDSRLILRAYQKWGAECPRHLLGDFAFAVWDARQQQLFCARDHLGARPFFYYADSHVFVFACDIRAILACTEVTDDVDESYLSGWLRELRFFHPERTFYQYVRNLPPAHSLLVASPASLLRQKYWNPCDAPQVRFRSDDRYAECLAELLQQAVDDRMRSAFPVGAHVSGGLDCSSIAVLAARRLHGSGRRLQGFSWSPPFDPSDPPLDDDERLLVQSIASKEQIDVHYVELRPEERAQHNRRDPSTDPQNTLGREHVASRCAGRLGIRVLLSGWGGNELASFGGRGYLAELFMRGRWHTLWREIKMYCRRYGHSPWNVFKGDVLYPLLPDAIYWRMKNRPSKLPDCLKPEFAAHIGKINPLTFRRWRALPGVRANQLASLERGAIARRIEHWATEGAVNHLVYCYPLLDRRIVDFCLGIPADQYFKSGWKRYLYRRAVEGILPADVQWHHIIDEAASVSATKAIEPDVRTSQNAWLGQRVDDPEWGRCVDLRDVLERRASEDPSRCEGLWKGLGAEIIYHNQRQRAASSQPNGNLARPAA